MKDSKRNVLKSEPEIEPMRPSVMVQLLYAVVTRMKLRLNCSVALVFKTMSKKFSYPVLNNWMLVWAVVYVVKRVKF